MDQHSEDRLALVIPELSDKIHTVYETLWNQGVEIWVVRALATWQDQQKLWDQGRTTPGKIVTNAPPGFSMHEFGLAVDCMPSLNPPGGVYVMDGVAGSPRYLAMRAVAEAEGLISGSRWTHIVDWPHLQLPNAPATPNTQMRNDLFRLGLQSVWKNYQSGLYEVKK